MLALRERHSARLSSSDSPPGRRRCHRFDVEGDVTFGADVVAVGQVRVTGPRHVPDGEVLGD